jgi:TRAP-type mannitol/chloroaromatic compound transport system substrate-binding protein
MKAKIGDEKKQTRIEYLKIAANYALPIFWEQAGFVKIMVQHLFWTQEKEFLELPQHMYSMLT